MNVEAVWGEEPLFLWMNALSLTAEIWTQPFLAEAGLSPVLCGQTECLRLVQAEAAEHQQALWTVVRATSPREEWEAALTQGVVAVILNGVSKEFGEEEAANFANWARRNVVREDWAAAMRIWQMILHALAASPNPEFVKLMQQVQPAVSREREIKFNKEVERACPPLTEEEQSIGLDAPPPALTLEQAAQREWTYQALQEIGRILPYQSRPEFLAWARGVAAQKGAEESRLMTDVLLPDSSYDFQSPMTFGL